MYLNSLQTKNVKQYSERSVLAVDRRSCTSEQKITSDRSPFI